MEDRFGAEWAQLSARERVVKCRMMAAEARNMALGSGGFARETYLSVARQWDRLADELERKERSKTGFTAHVSKREQMTLCEKYAQEAEQKGQSEAASRWREMAALIREQLANG